MRFLVDTGATFSLIPASRSLLRSTPMLRLKAANGRSVNVFAPTQKRVSFEGLGSFSWNFRPADTEFYILGADFLAHFGLVVDVGRLSFRHGSQQPLPGGDDRPLRSRGGFPRAVSTFYHERHG